MCDCLDEKKRKEKEAKDAKEAAAKIRAAQARPRAATSSSDSSKCTATCRSRGSSVSGGGSSGGFFSWLWSFFSGDSGHQPNPMPRERKKSKDSKQPPPPRSPIFFWMGLLLGTILLYITFAYLQCTFKDFDWRSRLESFRALFCDPCAALQLLYGLMESIRERAGQMFGGSKKVCRPKPPPPC